MERFSVIILLLLVFPALLWAQQGVRVEKSFFVDTPDTTVFLDFLIHTNTLTVEGAYEWQLFETTGHIRLKVDPPSLVLVTYFKVPLQIPRVTTAYELNEESQSELKLRPVIQASSAGANLHSSRLNQSGSITRGIIVGSNRDLTLESGMRFDLSGYITDDIYVLATLTDRSTPIQPEGTTQQLREFDQVYIRLQHEKAMMQLGDVDVHLSNSEFLKFNRRLQGAEIQANTGTFGTYQAAAAVMRGTYRSMELIGRDGVQGPYRLRGADNEPFIMVLAGTEKVYLNGRQLTRGEENDYIIDYGLGEISFTSRWLMTSDFRITVEFQYLTTNYTRTILTSDAEVHSLANGRLSFGAAYIREADDIRFADELGLTDTERAFLRAAGDDPSLAVVSGADSVGFRRDADFILYAQVDTIFNGNNYRIFKNIPGDPQGYFRVFFSNVGAGMGSYKRSAQLVNGIVYEWVGPGLGEYEPFRQLNAPREHQITALRTSYLLTDKISLASEWAISSIDKNRFSTLDSGDNTDHAWFMRLNTGTHQTIAGDFSANIRHRYTGRNFAAFDRFREVEYDRRWNIRSNLPSEELLNEATLNWNPASFTSLNIDGGWLQRDDLQSNRITFTGQSEEIGLPAIISITEYVESDDKILNQKGSWLRYSGETSYDISLSGQVITPVFRWDAEHNDQRDSQTHILDNISFRYRELEPGVRYRFRNAVQAGVSYGVRTDHEAVINRYRASSQTKTSTFSLLLEPNDQFRSTNRVGFRNREYTDFFQSNFARENVSGLMLHSVTDYRSSNRFLDTQLYYDVGSESRALYNDIFIEVGPEYGQYVWIDLNEDGVQQIDEFFPALSANEGTFIRQFVPSDELIPVTSLQTRFRVRIEPSRILGSRMDDNEFFRFLSGTIYTLRAEIREQSSNSNKSDVYLLRIHTFQQDSTTINGRMALFQELQMFRRNPKYDAQVQSDIYRSKVRLATGLESAKGWKLNSDFNYRFPEYAIVGAETEGRFTENLNAGVTGRNYRISGLETSPYLRIIFSRLVQSSLKTSFISRRDKFPDNNVRMRATRIQSDANVLIADKWSVYARIERRDVRLNGFSSPLAEYELTDGAGRGGTWSWSSQVNYRVSDMIRANFTYDGRTVTDSPSVQTLRLTITALF